MIHLALIPVLGVLLLLVLSVWVQSRRSARIAALKRSVEKKARSIVHKDAANDQQLVDNIIRGVGIDQALQHFQTTRTALLPGGHAGATVNWSADQLESWKVKSLRRGVESINRGLIVPAFFSAVVIVAVCVVATTVLYSFQSSSDGGSVSPTTPPTFAPVPLDPIPLPPVVQPPAVAPTTEAVTDPFTTSDPPQAEGEPPVADSTGSPEETTDPVPTNDGGVSV